MTDTRQIMQAIAAGLDDTLNPRGKKVGFVVLMFPFDQARGARTNYVSNCERTDVLAALKEIVARFEGQPHQEGTA